MYILINIDRGINKNILLKYLVISFNYKFIKLLLHFPSLFSIYILILITVIIVKIALKIAFLPIQLKWLITIIHGGSAKTGSRCTSPLQRAYHRFPATACRFRCRCSTNSRLESPDAPIASRYRPSSSSRRNEIGSWERRRMYDGYIRLARRLKHRGR